MITTRNTVIGSLERNKSIALSRIICRQIERSRRELMQMNFPNLFSFHKKRTKIM
jgi:hypothetical protein